MKVEMEMTLLIRMRKTVQILGIYNEERNWIIWHRKVNESKKGKWKLQLTYQTTLHKRILIQGVGKVGKGTNLLQLDRKVWKAIIANVTTERCT